MNGYGTLLVLFALAVLIAGALHILTSVLGPRARNAYKDEPFECGNIAPRPFRQRVSVKFYVVALLFIIFDMETVFLFPWAVVFKDLGWMGLVSMLTFVLVLMLGLVYVWRSGALDWE
jgi:NADH-quinone oxidoreductase subunit A